MCISVTSDAANCGACGKICPSNICIDGVCQGATRRRRPHRHDYTNANEGSAEAKVLVNALSIPTTDPIRVLSYETARRQKQWRKRRPCRIRIYGRRVRFTKRGAAP